MMFVQKLRLNDINPARGKQVELGKSFFECFGWKPGETYPVEIYYREKTIYTSFKVRGSDRGGERIGADCKEYTNNMGECPLKDFFIHSMRFTKKDVGVVRFVLENIDIQGRKFRLNFI